MFKKITETVILTDMDGTFLPSSKIPSQKDLEAADRFMAAGGRFSVATGRALHAVKQYFDKIRVNFPAVLCNGGLVYDMAEKQGRMNVYTPESTERIVKKILGDNPDIGCEVLTIRNVYVPQLNDAEKEHIGICKVQPVFCGLDDIPDRNWYKVLFADQPDRVDRLEEYVSRQDFSDVDFVRSSEKYYEILPKNISKGSCVNFIREKFCTENDVIICVGDYYNDAEMLKAADVAVCPSNAVEEIKQLCDVVLESSCEENAIAELIDRIFSSQN